MNDFGEEDNKKLIIMWGQVKASTNMVPYYIILLVILLAVPTYMLIKLIVDKTNEYYANKRLESKNNK